MERVKISSTNPFLTGVPRNTNQRGPVGGKMVNNNQWIRQLDVPIILRSCPVRGFRPRLREKCRSVQTPVYAVKHLLLCVRVVSVCVCACVCVCVCVRVCACVRGDKNRELKTV